MACKFKVGDQIIYEPFGSFGEVVEVDKDDDGLAYRIRLAGYSSPSNELWSSENNLSLRLTTLDRMAHVPVTEPPSPAAPVDKPVGETDAVLNTRSTTHGSYKDNARTTQHVKAYYRSQPGWNRLSDCQRETLDMVAHKISRALNGDPHERDHWLDMAGYSMLCVREIDGAFDEKEAEPPIVVGSATTDDGQAGW